jgi:hypothetical protein
MHARSIERRSAVGNERWIVRRAKLQPLIKRGRLTIIGPGSRRSTFGAGPDASAGSVAAACAVGALAAIELALRREPQFGEASISRAGGGPWLLSPSC